MSTQTELPTSSPARKRERIHERDVVFTANGSLDASRTIYRVGALIGMESLNTRPPRDIPVNFVDWPFRKLDAFSEISELFEAHLRVVRAERPRYAVAPDIDETVGYADAIAWADELAEYAETVIVVPKTVMPRMVPKRFRVGMPCQPRFVEMPWQWPDYQACSSVHLLGGSPRKHQAILKHFVPVESVDSAAPVRAAHFGSYWTGERWQEVEGSGNFYRCLASSYRNMRLALNPDRSVWSPRSRNRQLDYEAAFRELDTSGLFDHDDEIPRPSREAYMVCDSPRELAEYVLDGL